MFKALWIKHWIQLRSLRWVGFGLCLAMPLFLWTGAAAARRGWLPFNLENFSLTTLFGEALPALMMFVWVILALMFAGQSFAGDRADGTASFLLERPVPRSRIWLARASASLVSTLFVVASVTVYQLLLLRAVDDGSTVDPYSKVLQLCALGLGLAVLGTLGGMAAGEMVRTPMQAVLAGLVLAAMPLALATFLASAFSLVRLTREIHLAFVLSPIVPVALVLASYRSGCLGEPAGTGRIKRGVVVLAAGLLLTPALFAAMTPFVLRSNVQGGWPGGMATEADRAVVMAGTVNSGGWVLDTGAGQLGRFLAPPVLSAKWNADGTLLAVIHQAGPFGSIGRAVLEWFDPAGDSLGSVELDNERNSHARGMSWAGERILIREWTRSPGERIRVIDPRSGDIGLIEIEGFSGQAWRLLGPTQDGSVFVHRLTGQDPRIYELSKVNFEAMQLEPPVLVEQGDLPTYALRFLSPSGRYWARVVYSDEDPRSHVVDLQTGERIDYPGQVIAGWLSGDRLVRLQPVRLDVSDPATESEPEGTRVVVQDGVAAELLSRAFHGRVGAKPSPDGERLLITRRTADDRLFVYPYSSSIRTRDLEQMLVLDGENWVDLSSLTERLTRSEAWVSWGGPDSLVASNGTATLVAQPRPGATWKTVLGNWP